MNIIQLENNIPLEQYKMAIRVLKAMNIKVVEGDFSVSENELKAIKKGREQFKNGEVTSSKDVRKKALEICMR